MVHSAAVTASADVEHARYARMRWNTPLSEEHAALLLDRFDLQPRAAVLDLGCGWGELLLRAVAAKAAAIGIGVDIGAAALDRGRERAVARGLAERVSFVFRTRIGLTGGGRDGRVRRRGCRSYQLSQCMSESGSGRAAGLNSVPSV